MLPSISNLSAFAWAKSKSTCSSNSSFQHAGWDWGLKGDREFHSSLGESKKKSNEFVKIYGIVFFETRGLLWIQHVLYIVHQSLSPFLENNNDHFNHQGFMNKESGYAVEVCGTRRQTKQMLVPAGLLLEIRGFCLPIFCPTPCFRTAGASADIFFRLHRGKAAQRVACRGSRYLQRFVGYAGPFEASDLPQHVFHI